MSGRVNKGITESEELSSLPSLLLSFVQSLADGQIIFSNFSNYALPRILRGVMSYHSLRGIYDVHT